MIEGETKSAMLPRSWKKSFNSVVIIPKKMRFCIECKDGIFCATCNIRINEKKEFEANLNELKRHPPNEYGHMPRYYEI